MNVPRDPDEHVALDEGFLSDEQRRYLLGKKEYSEDDDTQDEKQIRNRIRKRTIGGILDLMLIGQHLDRRDRDLLFDNLPDGNPSGKELVDHIQAREQHPDQHEDVPPLEEVYSKKEGGEVLLSALTIVHGFIERGLMNTGRHPDQLGLFAMLFTMETALWSGENFAEEDLAYIGYRLGNAESEVSDEVLFEVLHILGLEDFGQGEED